MDRMQELLATAKEKKQGNPAEHTEPKEPNKEPEVELVDDDDDTRSIEQATNNNGDDVNFRGIDHVATGSLESAAISQEKLMELSKEQGDNFKAVVANLRNLHAALNEENPH